MIYEPRPTGGRPEAIAPPGFGKLGRVQQIRAAVARCWLDVLPEWSRRCLAVRSTYTQGL